MRISREEMISFLEEARKIELKKLYFGDPYPLPPPAFHLHYPPSRILMPLSGEKHILFASGGKRNDIIFTAGDAIVTHPYGWTKEVWDMPHRMISIVFYEECIRVLYIAHNGKPPDQNGPDVYFHTKYPLNQEGRLTLAALLSAEKDHAPARYNFHALLEIVTEALQDHTYHLSPHEMQWGRVLEALQNNFQNAIGREDIAEIAKVHPAQVSRLIRHYRGRTFSACLNELRLDYAVELMKNDTMTIEEIAHRSGFNYPSYFIRIFRRRFKVSPADYRKNMAFPVSGGRSVPDTEKSRLR